MGESRVARVLIVDDDPTARYTLESRLLGEDHDLVVAENGADTLDIARAHPPDLVLLDVMLTGMDGYEVCQQIKATTQGQATVIAALTASVLEEERTAILSAGCDDHVCKPFRDADICAKSARHLGVRYR